MITKELEYAIQRKYFNTSKLITTNITAGKIVSHECDILIVNKSNYLLEFELKVSKTDLLADLKKQHRHKCKNIRQTYFVIPVELKECISLIPIDFGVIVVKRQIIEKYDGEEVYYLCQIKRKPLTNKTNKITSDMFLELSRLASMRYWTCKKNELIRLGFLRKKS